MVIYSSRNVSVKPHHVPSAVTEFGVWGDKATSVIYVNFWCTKNATNWSTSNVKVRHLKRDEISVVFSKELDGYLALTYACLCECVFECMLCVRGSNKRFVFLLGQPNLNAEGRHALTPHGECSSDESELACQPLHWGEDAEPCYCGPE